MVERTKSKVRLSAFAETEGDLEFEWMGIPVWIRFKTGRLTWAFSERAKEISVAEAFDWLVETIVDWNLVDDNDEPLPITVESLDALPRTIAPSLLILQMLKWNLPDESE